MRNLLALIGLLTVVFVGVGWYRGWYDLDRTPSEDGQKSLRVNIDAGKIGTDTQTAFKETGNWFQELSESRGDEETKEEGRTPPPASLPGPAPRDDGDVNWWYPPK